MDAARWKALTERRREYVDDETFSRLRIAALAGFMALVVGVAFARLHGSGWASGAAFGAAVFVLAGLLFGLTATPSRPHDAASAPRDDLSAPRDAAGPPRDDASPIPRSTQSMPIEASTSAPAPQPSPRDADADAEDAPASSEQASHPAGDAAGKAVFGTSAAVTSAAAAARAAMSDMTAPAPEPTKPPTLAAPREGGSDDLRKLRGVGPKLESALHGLGFYHYDQIAGWTPAETAWVDRNLDGLRGSASRDDWVGQARSLLAGGGTNEGRVDGDGTR